MKRLILVLAVLSFLLIPTSDADAQVQFQKGRRIFNGGGEFSFARVGGANNLTLGAGMGLKWFVANKIAFGPGLTFGFALQDLGGANNVSLAVGALPSLRVYVSASEQGGFFLEPGIGFGIGTSPGSDIDFLLQWQAALGNTILLTESVGLDLAFGYRGNTTVSGFGFDTHNVFFGFGIAGFLPAKGGGGAKSGGSDGGGSFDDF